MMMFDGGLRRQLLDAMLVRAADAAPISMT